MNEFQIISIDQLQESPLNPRRRFDEAQMNELIESVRKNKILNPLIVRSVNGHMEILAGARRFRAAKAAGLQEVPTIVRQVSDDEALEILIYENDQRADIHPLEQAWGYQELLKRPGYDMAAVSAKTSRSESYIYQRLKLLDLIKPAQKKFLEDELTLGHAIQIARLQQAEQKEALQACFDEYHRENGKPMLTGVRQLAGWIQTHVLLDLHSAPFSKTETFAFAQPCVTCQKRTGFTPALFPDINKKDTCTDPACYKRKIQAHITVEKEKHQQAGEKLLEVTTEYSEPYGEKKIPGMIYKSSWSEVKKKDRCKHAKKAIVVHGRNNVGRVLEICSEPACKIHHGRNTYKLDPKEAARQKAEKLAKEKGKSLRARTLSEILARVPNALEREDWELLANCLSSQMQNDDIKIICRRRGWEPAKTQWGGQDFTGSVRSHLAGLTQYEIFKLLIELCLTIGAAFSHGEKSEHLNKYAERYGIDLKALEKAVNFEFEQKQKPAKAKPKSKAKPVEKSAAPGDDEHSCEICKCTESKACPGGCSWSAKYLAQDRYICSNCEDEEKPAKPKIKAAKTHKSAMTDAMKAYWKKRRAAAIRAGEGRA